MMEIRREGGGIGQEPTTGLVLGIEGTLEITRLDELPEVKCRG